MPSPLTFSIPLKKLSRVVLFSSLVLIALGTGCKKDPSLKPPQLPNTPEFLILGTWDLQYSVGSWGSQDTSWSDSTAIERLLTFRVDDSAVYYTKLRYPDTSYQDIYSYEFTRSLVGADSVTLIKIPGDYFFDLSKDTLSLDSRFRDGIYELYIRKPGI